MATAHPRPVSILPSSSFTQMPTRCGDWILERELDRGGMGDLYLARHVRDAVGRTVVIKCLPPHFASDEQHVQMFLREARILFSLSHPNVVDVLLLDRYQGRYFIVMEHLTGLDLRRLGLSAWRRDEVLPIDVVLLAVADAALGLDHAHDLGHRRQPAEAGHGIVHRDVSPDNLFLTTSGFTKVLDFGVAVAGPETHITGNSKTFRGKVPFTAPERFGEGPVDWRADLFSLGVCLFALLTGRLPFRGSGSLQVLRSLAGEDAPAPSSLRDDVPVAIDLLVAAMLQKDPEQRIQTAAEIYECLVAVCDSGRARVAAAALARRAVSERWCDDLKGGGDSDDKTLPVLSAKMRRMTDRPRIQRASASA